MEPHAPVSGDKCPHRASQHSLVLAGLGIDAHGSIGYQRNFFRKQMALEVFHGRGKVILGCQQVENLLPRPNTSRRSKLQKIFRQQRADLGTIAAEFGREKRGLQRVKMGAERGIGVKAIAHGA